MLPTLFLGSHKKRLISLNWLEIQPQNDLTLNLERVWLGEKGGIFFDSDIQFL